MFFRFLSLVIFALLAMSASAQEVKLYRVGDMAQAPILYRMHSLTVTLNQGGRACNSAAKTDPTLGFHFAEDPGISILSERFLGVVGRHIRLEYQRFCGARAVNEQFRVRVDSPGQKSTFGLVRLPKNKDIQPIWLNAPEMVASETRTSKIIDFAVGNSKKDLTPKYLAGKLLHEDEIIFGSILSAEVEAREALFFTRVLNADPCRHKKKSMNYAARAGSAIAQYASGACFVAKNAPKGKASPNYGKNFSEGIYNLIYLVSARENGMPRAASLMTNPKSPRGNFAFDRYPGLAYIYKNREDFYSKHGQIRIEVVNENDGRFFRLARRVAVNDIEKGFVEDVRGHVINLARAALKKSCIGQTKKGRQGTRWTNNVCEVTIDGAELSYWDLAFVEVNQCAEDFATCDYRYQVKCYANNFAGKKWCRDQPVQTGTLKLK